MDHATIAFGQGVSVTPIQLAAASAALANGGSYLRPRLVAARRVAGGRWQPTTREVAQRVLRPETARAVLAMLETVVGPTGTGHRAALRGVRVAGKTGTAQKWDAEAGRYSNATDVIRSGLRLLEEREQEVEALRRALIEGEESGVAGPLDIDEIKRQARRGAGLSSS